MSLASAKKGLKHQGKLTAAYHREMVKEDAEDNSHDDGYLHPSAVGGCPTRAALAILQVSELLPTGADSKGAKIYAMGHAVHDMLQKHFVNFGFIEEIDGKYAIELGISIEELKLGGSMDGLIRGEFTKTGKRAILEAKSMNSNALRKLSQPKPEHIIQGTCYHLGAIERGIISPDENEVIILYYGKDNSEMREFNHLVNPANIKDVKRRSELIWELVRKSRENNEFPAPYHDNPNAPPCSWCEWKGLCHDSLRRVDFLEKFYATEKPTPKKTVNGAPKRKRPRVRSR